SRHGDEGAVGERDPDVLALAPVDEVPVGVGAAPAAALPARRLHPVPAAVTGVVRPDEGGDDEVAGADRAHPGADLLHDADELVPDAARPADPADAPVGPQVGPADAAGGHPGDRAGRALDDSTRGVVHADV